MRNERERSEAERWQRWGALLLLVAILITAAAPSPRAGKGGKADRIFYLAEEDYNTPFIGSYLMVRALPFGSDCFSGFAGYEQHFSRLETPERPVLAQVTRFAGRLLEVAEVQFIARAEPGSGGRIYISERFWHEQFDAEVEVLGRELTVDGKAYRVAGITREQGGMFGDTDLWIAMSLREPAAQTESLRIVGRLREGVGWHQAEKELARFVRRLGIEQGQPFLWRMIPVSGTLRFESEPPAFVLHTTTAHAGS